MTRILKKGLTRHFNVFGPRFQEWLARMFPAFQGPVTFGHLSRDFRNTTMTETQRHSLSQLVALWVAMQAPELATN